LSSDIHPIEVCNVLNIFTEDINITFGSFDLHSDHVERARFTGTVSSQQTHNLSVISYVKRNTLYSLNVTVVSFG